MQKKQNKRRVPRRGILISAAVLILSLVILAAFLWKRDDDSVAAMAGIDYLEQLEQKDPATVKELLSEQRRQRMRQQCEALLEQLRSGEKDVWSFFEDYVILGDSRAVGFYYFDYLEQSRVLAGGGDTILSVAHHQEEIKAMAPSYIFLCYGLNDVSIGYWKTPEEYIAEYLRAIEQLRQQLPQATVIVSSILPARDPAFERSERWRNIPAYNTALEQMCRENGIPYVNNDQICEQNASLWQPDGIHVRQEFYPLWASNLVVAMLESTMEEDGA